MPDIWEASDSDDTDAVENGQGGRHTRRYHVIECDSSVVAASLARALAPLAVSTGNETLVRQRVKTTPNGFEIWKVDVEYGSEDDPQSKEPPTPGTWKFSFDTTGGRHTITSSTVISRHWGDFGDYDLQGAINYDGKSVAGVEIAVPALKFQITAYYEPAAVTTSFMREIARKTARTNTDNWLGFEPGELLYFGGQGQGDIPTIAGQRVQPIAIVHSFEASQNTTVTEAAYLTRKIVSSGSEQSSNQIEKKGWHYFWTWFKRRENEDFSKVVGRPAHGYVHKIYEELAFAAFFGFGGTP